MFGDNPIRKPEKGDGSLLQVQEIFPTLQGEGPLAGHPAVFVRLGGCNLACTFCDTEFEDFREQTLGDILAEVQVKAENHTGERVRKLVVITGGEPFRQPIAPLCEALIAAGFSVQIETNGTLWREIPEAVQIVCSPKQSGGHYAPIRGDLLPRLTALKFLLSTRREGYGSVPEIGQSDYHVPVYVQPMDEYDEAQNAANRALAVKIASERGYCLSLQQHKLLGIA